MYRNHTLLILRIVCWKIILNLKYPSSTVNKKMQQFLQTKDHNRGHQKTIIPCAMSVRWTIKQTKMNHLSSSVMNQWIIYRLYLQWRQRLQLQSPREKACRESVSHGNLPGQTVTVMCFTAANSHFHSSDDTLTFSTLDVLTAVQVTAQVRWRARQAAHHIGLMKELMNVLLRWATVLQCWQQVKSTWAHGEKK